MAPSELFLDLAHDIAAGSRTEVLTISYFKAIGLTCFILSNPTMHPLAQPEKLDFL